MTDQGTRRAATNVSDAQKKTDTTSVEQRIVSESAQKSGTYLEIYRITANFASKLLLPAVLVFIILTFRPTVDSLLLRTTEFEIAGTKFKFAEEISAKVDEAIRSGDTRKIEATISQFTKDAAGGLIRSYWKPDGVTIDAENQNIIRAWMVSNGIETSVTFFLHAQEFEDARLTAVKELGLSE